MCIPGRDGPDDAVWTGFASGAAIDPWAVKSRGVKPVAFCKAAAKPGAGAAAGAACWDTSRRLLPLICIGKN